MNSLHWPLVVGERGHRDEHGFYRLSPWELVTGAVTGFVPVRASEPTPGLSARKRFEQVVLEALQHSPCLVAFSGGRDSSAILAVAVELARREGLPPPAVYTHVFDGVAGTESTDESRFQELMVKRLGITDWVRIKDPDAFDILGSRAQQGLRRFGLLFPALIHCHTPLIDAVAGGGGIITGEGGDEILGPQRVSYLHAYLAERSRPSWELLQLMATTLGPRPLRRRMFYRDMRTLGSHTWIDQRLANRVLHDLAADSAGGPLRWDRSVLRELGRRAAVEVAHTLRNVYAADGVRMYTPFLDESFVAAWAREGGPVGYVSRTANMRRLFSDLVPDEICARDDKAEFSAVAVGERSKAFMRTWDGTGVDTSIVDVEKLRQACLADSPFFGTQMLVQAAWLGSQGLPLSHPASTTAAA